MPSPPSTKKKNKNLYPKSSTTIAKKNPKPAEAKQTATT